MSDEIDFHEDRRYVFVACGWAVSVDSYTLVISYDVIHDNTAVCSSLVA